jgi:hypothetical protein
MLDKGTKVRVNEDGIDGGVWGLPHWPDGKVVDHLHGYNVVHLVLGRDPEGIAKGPSPTSPGWLFRDEELDVV